MYTEIKELIPHRDPFLFVDAIVSTSIDEIIGVKTFNESNSWLKGRFPGADIVPGTILFESMAQCGGAGIKLLGLAEGLFGLVSIKKVQFYKYAEFGKQIKFVIQNVRLSEKIIKQSGKAYVDDDLIMEASWMIVKIE